MRLRTTVYRAHNPRWSFAPLSGADAARYGGRFNPTGMEALYTESIKICGVAWPALRKAGRLELVSH